MKLQEYLDQKYPTKEDKEKVEEIDIIEHSTTYWKEIGKYGLVPIGIMDVEELDLSEFKNLKRIKLQRVSELNVAGLVNLEDINCSRSNLVFLDLRDCISLKALDCSNNKLISADFLKTLPNPDKLEILQIYNNNIKPTNIEVFSEFVNLKNLRIGTQSSYLEKKHNKFYGSLKSYRNISNLSTICIEATDINEGLEYLPLNLGKGYDNIECSPHGTNAKCSQIQDQLRPFNYDLEAWQLAHPHKIYKAQPELFFDYKVKTKWLTSLRDKITKTQSKLNETKEKEPQAIKRIKRLETKLDNLKLIQDNISNHALIEKLEKEKSERLEIKTENEETQTELTKETIIELLQKLEVKN